MKKTLNILFVFVLFNSFSQTTSVPDANFEQALINLGYDIALDGSVLTASINNITVLDVNSSNISDLTGIQDFSSLTELYCWGNSLTALDLTGIAGLQILDLSGNQVNSLNITSNLNLVTFDCGNNNLSTLDLSQHLSLVHFWCIGNNITELNLSNNTNLEIVNCSDNNLNCLNIANGNNSNFQFLIATNNPNLSCIEVDDEVWANNNWTVAGGAIDATMSFSNYCGNSCSTVGLSELTSYERELTQILDISGRETDFKTNTLLIYIYSDGSTEKVFQLE